MWLWVVDGLCFATDKAKKCCKISNIFLHLIAQRTRNLPCGLAELSAEVDHATQDGTTGLVLFCFREHLDVVSRLAELGAEVDLAKQDGMTGLMVACFSGHLDVVNRLAELGAEVDHADQDGRTDLMGECESGHLIACGEPTGRARCRGGSCYARWNDRPDACLFQRAHLDVVNRLVQLGTDVHHQFKDGTGEHDCSSLMTASEGGHLHVAVRLTQLGAAMNHSAENLKGSTALSLACQNGHLDIVDWVLSTLKTPEICHHMAMMRAIKGHHFDVVAQLLAAGCGCRFPA